MRTPVVAAIDVGGTRIKASLVDARYEVGAQITVPTPQNIADHLPETVADILESLLSQSQEGSPDLRGCGIVVPGRVDEQAGLGILSVNLGWQDLPIRGLLTQVLDVPVTVGHDVRAGLLAESRLGASIGQRHVVFVPVGTGVAGALMLDGHVVSADGCAGELGHLIVRPQGRPCPCGQRGCLETVASASAIERAYADQCGEGLTAHEIAKLVGKRDPLASTIWQEAVDALVEGLVATVTLTGVEVVVLGGGLAQSGALLVDRVRDGLASRLTFQRVPSVVPAALGDRAGSMGAACLIWDKL